MSPIYLIIIIVYNFIMVYNILYFNELCGERSLESFLSLAVCNHLLLQCCNIKLENASACIGVSKSPRQANAVQHHRG